MLMSVEKKGKWLNMIYVLTKVKCPYCESDIEVNSNEYIADSTSSEKRYGNRYSIDNRK